MHTPGPWRYDAQNHQIRTGPPTEARFSGECIGSVSPLIPEMPANAKLIAAAPELLSALKEARAQLYKLGVGMGHVDAAISRAEGK